MEQKKSTKFSLHVLNLVKVLVYESCTAAVGLNAAVNLFFCFYSTYYFMVTGVQYTSLILQ
jgi:hypothetical protein